MTIRVIANNFPKSLSPTDLPLREAWRFVLLLLEKQGKRQPVSATPRARLPLAAVPADTFVQQGASSFLLRCFATLLAHAVESNYPP